MPQPYAQLLARLYAQRVDGNRFTLARIQALLRALGSPEHALSVILVAGTNGKGTTSRLLASALERSGHKTGLYTSPHLLRFAERVRVDGEPLPDAAVAEHAHTVLCAAEGLSGGATFFECTTALALCAFRAQGCTLAVLEVGVGGRLDATNATEPKLCVITPIARDHMAWLGNDLGSIAEEKAGIMRRGVPVVWAHQSPEVEARLIRLAHEKGARRVAQAPLPSGVHPPYLATNVATARAAFLEFGRLGYHCPPYALAAAEQKLVWPGRYQWHKEGNRLWLLDGGHNPAGCQALAEALRDCPTRAGRKMVVLFAAFADKEGDAMLAFLRPYACHLIVAPQAGLRALTQSERERLAHAFCGEAPATLAQALACACARSDAAGGAPILVVGSLRLVGNVMAYLGLGKADPEPEE